MAAATVGVATVVANPVICTDLHSHRWLTERGQKHSINQGTCVVPLSLQEAQSF
jgi:hypothetical protein